jgi:FkbM family methyltransferase
MLDFITEKISCWDILKNDKRPIFIYGMGDGALKIMNIFEKYGISVSGFFASDEFVRGHYFCGHLVHKLSDIENSIDDFIIVLAFAAGYQSLYDRIKNIAQHHTLFAPDVPVAGNGLFTYDYCLEHSDEIRKVYDMLADEDSRKTFSDVINFKISGKIDYLDRCTSAKSDIYQNIIKPTGNEIYIDLGAYNGDTIQEFIDFAGDYKQIIAVEPDGKNFKKLIKNTQHLENFQAFNAVVWNSNGSVGFNSKHGRQSSVSNDGDKTQAVCVDGILNNNRATIIKMDIEGAEYEAIKGAKQTIENVSPSLMISLYHRNEDLFKLPLLIKSINPDYKFFIRHQLYIPAWETNLYCIP